MKVVDMLEHVHQDQHVKTAFTEWDPFRQVAGEIHFGIGNNVERKRFAAGVGLSEIPVPRADIEEKRILVQTMNLRLQKAPVGLPPRRALIGSALDGLIHMSGLRHGREDRLTIKKRDIASAVRTAQGRVIHLFESVFAVWTDEHGE